VFIAIFQQIHDLNDKSFRIAPGNLVAGLFPVVNIEIK
jgi:hypothetical protein